MLAARRLASRLPLPVLLLALCSPLAGSAQNGITLAKELPPAERGDAYWTAERMRQARPMPLPKADPSASPGHPEAGSRGPSIGGAAAPPTRSVRSEDAELLFEVTDAEAAELAATWAALEASEAGDAASVGRDRSENVGLAGAHFSSSRVFPDAATTAYPYLTVGKLFFTQPGVGDFVCSGATIQKRLVLTAGHCVHRGSGGNGGFFTNFEFVPAFRNGVAPAGTWSATFVVTTTTWVNGGGVVPNAGDYAVLEMIDQAGQRIFNVTGHLGFLTQKLLPNHVHLLGYPANHDSGNRMHQVTAQSFKKLAPNTVQYGSDMRGGSSGGPWVQNFGEAAAGQTGGQNAAANRVVGVTSYGPNSLGPLIQGSSILDNNFTNNQKTGVLDTACKHRAGNCT